MADEIADRFVRCLVDHKIKLVCFDFDETITVHRRFISNAFRRVASRLAQANILGAIVTFNLNPGLPSRLKRLNIEFPVFARAIDRDVAFGKQWHIRQSLEHYRPEGILFRNVLLVDDLDNNIKWARRCGCNALEVQGRNGLGSSDLLRCMTQTKLYFPYAHFHPRDLFKTNSNPVPWRRSVQDGLQGLKKLKKQIIRLPGLDQYGNRYWRYGVVQDKTFLPLFYVEGEKKSSEKGYEEKKSSR